MFGKWWLGVLLAMATTVCWSAEQKPTLHIYTWQDYFDSEVLQEFQDRHNCTVVLTYFVSNEDLYETLETARGDFDIITPSAYLTSRLQREGYLAALDLKKIPNIRHLDPEVKNILIDADMQFSVPYTRTVCGVGYNRDLVKPDSLGGWGIFANPAYRGKITMIEDMREVIGAALKGLGYSLNSTNDKELAEAESVLNKWLGNLSGFIYDSEFVIINDTNSVVSLNYNGGIALAMTEEEDADSIGFYIPEGGGSIVIDDFVIPRDAQQPGLAHAFINHMLEPEMARINMESIFFYMYISAAVEQLPSALKDNPAFAPPAKLVAQCEQIRDLGADIRKYETIWEKILARVGK